MQNPALAYRRFSVQGATSLGLVVMLYDGAIAAMQGAIAAIEDHNIQKKCSHVNRALAIIAQLEGTLNFQHGGEVAQTLKSLYVYARTQLLKAHVENSAQILHGLIEKISTVREAWYQADRRPSTAAPAPVGSDAAAENPHRAPKTPSPYAPMPAAEDPPRSSGPIREPGSWRVLA